MSVTVLRQMTPFSITVFRDFFSEAAEHHRPSLSQFLIRISKFVFLMQSANHMLDTHVFKQILPTDYLFTEMDFKLRVYARINTKNCSY
jgi:hypothetical protein